MTEIRGTTFLKFNSACRLSFTQKWLLAGLMGASLYGLHPNQAYAAGIVGNGSAASCTDAALKQALSGGGTVTFKCGSAAKTIYLGSENAIAAHTVIDGGNLISLNGSNAKRIFNVQNGKNLTLKNITLANGYTAGQGGAIYAAYQNLLSIYNCKFINNTSTQLGEAGGGAIFTSIGAAVIDRSTFTGNKAGVGGAMKALNSNLTITGSVFTGNKSTNTNGGSGGAIGIDGAKGDNGVITIRTSTFQNNSATSYGGAIFNNIYNNNKTAITDSVFTGNTVGGGNNGQGGAIWSKGDPAKGGHWVSNVNNTTLTIVNTTLSGNVASEQGGGIFIVNHPSGAVISQSTINGNQTKKSMGGGIKVGSGKFSLVNSTISDNKANGQFSMGAGMYAGSEAKVYLTNVTVANNTANWQAGGIYGAANVNLKNTILANNVALNGGNTWNIKHNCFQPMANGGNNLQFPLPKDAACTSGMRIADPKLAALANNGGKTLTRALQSGSAAAGRASGCPAADQRGIGRALPSGAYCDIGAFEATF